MKKLIVIIFSVMAMILSMSMPVFADVDPASVDEVIPAGGSVEVEKTVSIPEILSNPDIVFLADTTGSMGPALANIQANIGTIIGTVTGSQPTAQFGVAQYKDVGDVFIYNLDQSITANTTDVTNAVNSWSASGGGDTLEAQLYALDQLATSASVGFRAGSTRIIVWFGDASGHDPSNGVTLAGAISDLTTGANSPIRVIAVPVDSGFGDGLDSTGQATAITGATGGVLVPSTNPGDVSDAIIAGLQALTTDVWGEVTTPNPYLTITLDPLVHFAVVSGTSVVFNETIAVAENAPQCDDPLTPEIENVLHATVTFYANTYPVQGEVVGVEEITITVPDTTPPTIASVETVNPAGKKVPPAGSTTLPGTKGGMNEDGFYVLTAEDNCDPNPMIYVVDTALNVFGPFTSGTVVKFTEDPTSAPIIKPMGGPNSAVQWHIILASDAIVVSVDASGNVSDLDYQLVPPLPK